MRRKGLGCWKSAILFGILVFQPSYGWAQDAPVEESQAATEQSLSEDAADAKSRRKAQRE